MRIVMACIVFFAMVEPALNDDVPFAQPPPARLGNSSQAYYSTLGDIMGLTQLRHIKLWYAGRAENWPLVAFEVSQIRDTFYKASMFYNDLPSAEIATIEKPLVILSDAVAVKDEGRFLQGYNMLTKACNGCHQSAQVGFIAIQTPTASPFNDQKF